MTIQYLSQEKFDSLTQELEDIQKIKMPETAVRIDEAKEMGDLKENAEYHAARERMGWLNGRLQEIEYVLRNSEILSQKTGGDTVVVGSTVVIEVNNKKREYSIVGAQEADPLEGKISNESPIGSALLNKKKGDSIDITLPAGVQTYNILDIK
jgi:transcription elongation factor GreA